MHLSTTCDRTPLLWPIAESQPVATAATINLLARSIAEAEAGVDAG